LAERQLLVEYTEHIRADGFQRADSIHPPDQFSPVRGTPAKENDETGEICAPDRLHKDHWEVYKNRKQYEKNKRCRSVWNDARLKERF